MAAFSFELNQCETPEIRIAVLGGLLSKIDAQLAERVALNLGIDLPHAIEAKPKPAYWRSPILMRNFKANDA